MKKRVLYLSYNGMMEPLGASQVLSYVYKLSNTYEYTLLSLEKPADLQNKAEFDLLKSQLLEKGIRWIPISYGESKIGKLLNFFRFTAKVFGIVRKDKLRYIHCRSYITAIPAWFVKKFYPVTYLFDTRNFWFDERADIGSLDRGKFLYKFLKRLEKRLYKKAGGIVILARSGKATVLNNELFRGGDSIKNIEIIPTCVDLDRFVQHQREYKKPVTIGYIGTAVGWYDFEKTAITLSKIGEFMDYNFLIFNNDQYNQHAFIKETLSKYQIPSEKYRIEKISFAEMPSRLKEIDISLFYIHPYFSKKASAATKLGELLASGIPVLTNKDVGDHEYYIEQYSVGKIIDFEELDTYNFSEVITPLLNQATSNRCRNLAETYFSLDKGVEKYQEIYERIFKN